MIERPAPTPARHYVYVHRRLSDLTVFYVGKGVGRRAWGSSGRNAWWKRVTARHGRSVQIVKDGLSEPCALALERAAIHILGKRSLVNLVDGGGGTAGWKHSDETKARIGSYHRGRPKGAAAIEATRLHHLGRSLTPEHRLKLSAAKAGRSRGPLPEAVKLKIAASHTGLRPSAETLRKMSEAKVGRSVGRDSPTYDHTERTFSHPEHGRFVGTRADLIAQHSLSAGCISSLINGKRKSVKGWILS